MDSTPELKKVNNPHIDPVKEKKDHHNPLYLGKTILKASYFGWSKMENGAFYLNEGKVSSQRLHSRWGEDGFLNPNG